MKYRITECIDKTLDIEMSVGLYNDKFILLVNSYAVLTIDHFGKCKLVGCCEGCGLDVDKEGKIILSN